MKRLARVHVTFTAVTAALAIVVGSAVYTAAKEGGNPFIDHADTGELIHVLPTPASIRSPRDTQPTEAPPANGTAVYAASYGSGKLVDHGGHEIANAGFTGIYWNTKVSDSQQTSLGYGTITDQIQAFVSQFPDNNNWSNSTLDDYTIVQQFLRVSQPLHL